MNDRMAHIETLYAGRRRNRSTRWSIGLLLGIGAYSWLWGFVSGEVDLSDTFSQRRLHNLERFLGEIRPYPLHNKDWNWGVVLEWSGDLLNHPGLEAAGLTLAISVVAICMAAIGGALLALPAAHTVTRGDPFVSGPEPIKYLTRISWTALRVLIRGLMVFMRAIPEYIWAFLFLRMFGVTPWPAVLALALHNVGILGRLQSEIIENVEPEPPASLRQIGATRRQVTLFALIPMTFNRFLLFFFYRWETCIREATVLGLLGMASLGAEINEARAGQHLDEMSFFVLLSAALVMVGDFVSIYARRVVRHAS